jgi:hypothetical protein
MADAQESVGSANVWPIAGMILSAADPTRQGAAAAPHPAKPKITNSRSTTRIDPVIARSIIVPSVYSAAAGTPPSQASRSASARVV